MRERVEVLQLLHDVGVQLSGLVLQNMVVALLTVVTNLFQILNGHENARQLRDLGQLLGRGFFFFIFQLGFLVVDVFKLLVQIGDLVVKLHDLGIHLLLVASDLLLLVLQLVL